MEAKTEPNTQRAAVALERDGGTLRIRLSGTWHLSRDVPDIAPLFRQLTSGPVRQIGFDCSGLAGWDSSLLAFVEKISQLCRARGIMEDRSGLPRGMIRLLELAEAVPEKEGTRGNGAAPGFVARLGGDVIGYADGLLEFLHFLGEVSIAIWRMFEGRARFRRVDMMIAIQDCGAKAFGIVTLISFLVGVILAFMGAVQLEQFGASIYVADLVAIGIARDMGAMMTAIIMAGRTGAAFAAQLGTMKVTQEIDSLTTMGISPMEFLVLPRVLALSLMMPLLCLYADFVGMLGGAAVCAGMLGISFNVFAQEATHAVHLGDMIGGLVKATIYGVIVAVSGCLRGFQCGNSSSAVGDAATAAVVTGIIYVVTACGLSALVFNILGV
jgi:phospholipid/cholesterol/gamma-HCH transport system permease protein